MGHAHNGEQGQLLPLTDAVTAPAAAFVVGAGDLRTNGITLKPALLFLIPFFVAGSADAQAVREHTRPDSRGETTITESQAAALTLTLSAASLRPIQSWIRTAGTIDETGKRLYASLPLPEAQLVKVGQRVRAFPPSSKSSMYQAWITLVAPRDRSVMVEASLASSGRQNAEHYVMEIVVERGPFLSVPNEAIIEEGDRRVVYVQRQPGQYVAVEIQTGIQGELYTQVLDGLSEGDQVVTFGSFFIDAEHKLKGTEQAR